MSLVHLLLACATSTRRLDVPRQVLFNGVIAGLVYGVLAVGHRADLPVVASHQLRLRRDRGALGAVMSPAGVPLGLELLPVACSWSSSSAPLLSAVHRAHRRAPAVRRAPRHPVRRDARRRPARDPARNCCCPARRASSTSPPRSRRSSRSAAILVRGEHIVVFVVVPLVTLALALVPGPHPVRPRDPGVGREPRCRRPRRRSSPGGCRPRCGRSPVRFAALTAVLVGPFQIGTGVGRRRQAPAPGSLLRALAAALIGGMVSTAARLARRRRRSASSRRCSTTNVINTPSLIAWCCSCSSSCWCSSAAGLARPGRRRRRRLVVLAPHQARSPKRCGRVVGPATPVARRRRSRSRGARSPLPFVITLASSQFLYSRMLLFALVALSLTVLTGWAGQLSLGQFAFVGLGAFTTAALRHRRHSLRRSAVLVGGVVGMLAAVVVGAPRAAGQGPVPRGHHARVRDRHRDSGCSSRSLFLGDTASADPAPRRTSVPSTSTRSAPTTTCASRPWRSSSWSSPAAQQRDRALA